MWNNNDGIIKVADNINTSEKRFPCKCPVCGKTSAHIYIHDYDKRHCGIWTWCGACGSYSHMSGETPKWWKNPEFINTEQLCSEPEYLDKMSDKIDMWINDAALKGNRCSNEAFVIEDKFKVRLTEEYQEIKAGTIGTLIIRDDLKTMRISFANVKGDEIILDIQPERVKEIFEVIQ